MFSASDMSYLKFILELCLKYMGYVIVGIIVSVIILYFYSRYTRGKIKKLEDKFSNYLKDLDELNEEWADENHELWQFIEYIITENDIKKIKQKAQTLIQLRNHSKKIKP